MVGDGNVRKITNVDATVEIELCRIFTLFTAQYGPKALENMWKQEKKEAIVDLCKQKEIDLPQK